MNLKSASTYSLFIFLFAIVSAGCGENGFLIDPADRLTDALTVRDFGTEGGNPDNGVVNSHEEVALLVTLFNPTEYDLGIHNTFLTTRSEEIVVINGNPRCTQISYAGECQDLNSGSERTLNVGRIRVSPQAVGDHELNLRVTGTMMTRKANPDTGAEEEWSKFEKDVVLTVPVAEASPIYTVSSISENVGPVEDDGWIYQQYELKVINQGQQRGGEPSVTITTVPEGCCRLNENGGRGTPVSEVELGISSENYNWNMVGGKESKGRYFWLGVTTVTPQKLVFTFSDDSGRTYEQDEVAFQ